MKKKFEFSEEGKSLVKEAVQSLEQETSGEMVVYFARSSDDYLMACWKLATILGLLTSMVMGILSWQWMLPDDITILHVTLSIFISSVLGYLIPYSIPSLRLGFIPSGIVEHRVLTKARDIFLQEQIFDTDDRIGILIYISEREKMVQVIGDEGINQKIEQPTWNEVVHLVIQGIKKGQPAEGIANAINKCKDLLLSHDFVNIEKDENELSDDMRIED